MRILIVGGGGRENAIAWALARSKKKPVLYFAPGNAGTLTYGLNVPIATTDLDALLIFAKRERIDLTVVGPEQPLVLGLVDRFIEAGLCVIGPTALAARLEGSKAFAKAFMERHQIPTAAHRTFSISEYDGATAYLEAQGAPIVLKASGLAAGKGAIVCQTLDEAKKALDSMMLEHVFGKAGDHVVVESFMTGEEASIFALTDGKDYVLLASAQDHKRVGEGDTGPNTGGMGAYAPAPVMTPALIEQVCREIIEPTLHGMTSEGYPYQGVLYVGLMITENGPKVVEYNCRLGDPETQVVLPLLQSDFVDLLLKISEGRLGGYEVRHQQSAAACIVLASAGYPGAYKKGRVISGIEDCTNRQDIAIFHAGTAQDEEGRYVTNGGRVLGITAVGRTLAEALIRAYQMVDLIDFEGKQYRRDIGYRGLDRLGYC